MAYKEPEVKGTGTSQVEVKLKEAQAKLKEAEAKLAESEAKLKECELHLKGEKTEEYITPENERNANGCKKSICFFFLNSEKAYWLTINNAYCRRNYGLEII